MDNKVLELYDAAVAKCSRFKRKGKNNPYTSANGYMFSLINKDNELGIRFSKEMQEQLIKELGTGYFKSYGATMKGYVLMPEQLLSDIDKIAEYLNISYDYVMTLQPK